MNAFRILSITLVLALGAQAVPAAAMQASSAQAHDNISGDPNYTLEAPPAYAMIGDLVIARPLLIAATAIGAVLFVVALPFAALGGNVKATGQALVLDPGRAAFVRCLGCSGDENEQ